jgi:hypothetical protein
VKQYDLDMNFIAEYRSIRQAADATNLDRKTIYNSCHNVIKKPKKYIFQYA